MLSYFIFLTNIRRDGRRVRMRPYRIFTQDDFDDSLFTIDEFAPRSISDFYWPRNFGEARPASPREVAARRWPQKVRKTGRGHDDFRCLPFLPSAIGRQFLEFPLATVSPPAHDRLRFHAFHQYFSAITSRFTYYASYCLHSLVGAANSLSPKARG